MRSGNDERFFEKKKIKIEIEIGFTISMEEIKRKKLDTNRHINPIFYASPRPRDARLIAILIICLILPPQ